MKIKLAVLADYANVSQEGKLNIMGIFERVLASSVPIRHPEMKLVIRMAVAHAEQDRDHDVEIQCMDSDDAKLFSVGGRFRVERSEGIVEPVHVNQILDIRDLIFNKFGSYTFSILINNEIREQIALDIDQMPQEPRLPGM